MRYVTQKRSIVMIFDELSQFSLYTNLHKQFADVKTYISNTDLQALPNGKHPINNSGAFASVNEYEPKPETDCFVECHRKYIDIQLITTGEEYIGYCPVSDCTAQPYDEEKDLQKLSGTVSYLRMKPGMFAIFFPHDGHMPCMRVQETPSKVKKVVFKIPV